MLELCVSWSSCSSVIFPSCSWCLCTDLCVKSAILVVVVSFRLRLLLLSYSSPSLHLHLHLHCASLLICLVVSVRGCSSVCSWSSCSSLFVLLVHGTCAPSSSSSKLIFVVVVVDCFFVLSSSSLVLRLSRHFELTSPCASQSLHSIVVDTFSSCCLHD